MDEFQIYNNIKKAQENKEVLYDLTVMFEPLLKKYAYYLNYEDAYYDLLLDFIELILKLNADKLENINNQTMLAYIRNSIYNGYLKRAKKYSAYRRFNCCLIEGTEDKQLGEDLSQTACQSYDELKELCTKCLTDSENEIILLLFYFGYNSAEIARTKHISRQAVNQTKTRALSKLRKRIV